MGQSGTKHQRQLRDWAKIVSFRETPWACRRGAKQDLMAGLLDPPLTEREGPAHRERPMHLEVHHVDLRADVY